MEKIYFEPNNPNKLSETNEIHNSPWDGSNISDPPPPPSYMENVGLFACEIQLEVSLYR